MGVIRQVAVDAGQAAGVVITVIGGSDEGGGGDGEAVIAVDLGVLAQFVVGEVNAFVIDAVAADSGGLLEGLEAFSSIPGFRGCSNGSYCASYRVAKCTSGADAIASAVLVHGRGVPGDMSTAGVPFLEGGR